MTVLLLLLVGTQPSGSWASLIAQLVKNPHAEYLRSLLPWPVITLKIQKHLLFIHSSKTKLMYKKKKKKKESTCNAGDPSSIPGSGRSTGEGIGYPLQYSGASLVAHLVKNLPAMQKTWV